MKRNLILSLLLTGAFALNASAQLLLDESFDYKESQLGESSRWNSVRAEDNEYNELKNLRLDLTENTLNYSVQGATYAGAGRGKALSVDFYASKWVNKQLITSFKRQTKGVTYLSVLIRMDQMPVYNNNVRHASQFTAIGLSDNGTSRGPMLWVRKVADTEAYGFGLTLGSRRAEDIVWSDATYDTAGRTHLVVLKYDLASKSAALFIDPIPGASEPTPAVIVPTREDAVRAIGSVFLYFFQPKINQTFSLAAIRVGNRWEDTVAAQ